MPDLPSIQTPATRSHRELRVAPLANLRMVGMHLANRHLGHRPALRHLEVRIPLPWELALASAHLEPLQVQRPPLHLAHRLHLVLLVHLHLARNPERPVLSDPHHLGHLPLDRPTRQRHLEHRRPLNQPSERHLLLSQLLGRHPRLNRPLEALQHPSRLSEPLPHPNLHLAP